ncbi:MAG: 1,4-alpha-glucan branching protein GlgB [Clostridia bacterium]|nr:1,4-alpha-glucan branching protein GlgB [Clostridia bacterium]
MVYQAPTSEEREAFHQGQNAHVYRMLGVHSAVQDGKAVWHFAVWAPNAQAVSLVGTFNGWKRDTHPMIKQFDGTWEIRLPSEVFPEAADDTACFYKYAVTGVDGVVRELADPYSFRMQMQPHFASIVTSMEGYAWQDDAWMAKRKQRDLKGSPMNIYEVHLPAWKPEAGAQGTYLSLAERLIPYVKKLGYTHVELLPVMEHLTDETLGYEVVGYFAPASRYGQARELMELIDRFHQADIGVILDWEPAMFPKGASNLRFFDGTSLYEHPDPRKGELSVKQALLFDLARGEVQSFLLSAGAFWLEWFHADGLRANSVSAMIYHDFCRQEGQWVPNEYGGRENLQGIALLQRMNALYQKEFPGVVLIAQEEQAYPGVTRASAEGGLGFTFKWNTGWLADILSYIRYPQHERKWHHDKLTFSLFYAFSEHFVLPFSHTLAMEGGFRMAEEGLEERVAWAGRRALYGYQMAHPGKKLMLMGGEIGESGVWRGTGAQWAQAEDAQHLMFTQYITRLNELYAATAAFYAQDDSWSGFQWTQANDSDNSVVGFLRWDREGRAVLCVTNFISKPHNVYRMGLPVAGEIRELLNSDAKEFGGSGMANDAVIRTEPVAQGEMKHSVQIKIPPLSTVYFLFQRA